MNKRLINLFAAFLVLLSILAPAAPIQAAPAPFLLPGQGCTVFYGSDGQTVLGANNEDFNNPFTLVWFIPASPGKYGRVYFGYDDFLPQGGMNDQGVFFDDLGLDYKDTPLTNRRSRYPGSLYTLIDQVLATSANVEEAIALFSRWYRPAGGYSQTLIGDRFGNSVIIDGDTVLRKQGAFQLATNFRLVEHPNPPYSDQRYSVAYDMLSKADHFSVDLFRRVLDAVHLEGESPTLYSQVYELKTGIIHLYQYHDFEREVVLNLADELAKGPHVATIASLFPENPDLEKWTTMQELYWKANYQWIINTSIAPSSLAWMSGEYAIQEEAEAGPVKVYLENGQLYLQKPNQLPIELYPASPNTVFHHFFNGFDLTLTFQRDGQGQATGAQGAFSYKPYNIEQPYHLARAGVFSYTSLLIIAAGAVLALILIGGILWLVRKRPGKLAA